MARNEANVVWMKRESLLPLVVDLEESLLPTNLLVESIFAVARKRPSALLSIPEWLRHGVGRLQYELSNVARPDAYTLPYRAECLDYLRAEHASGRSIVLVSSACSVLANEVAKALGLFDAVIASDTEERLTVSQKRAELVRRFGLHGFDYATNITGDSEVLEAARQVVHAHGPALEQAPWREYWRALRPHHWLKNALVFLPIVAAHRVFEPLMVGRAALAFLAFSLMASSVYLLNDLLDLPADRLHPLKHSRALASGKIGLGSALALIPVLWIAAGLLGSTLGAGFLGMLAAYLIVMTLYSSIVKHVPIADVMFLAAGYSLRVAAGAVAVGIAPSPWLMAFCVFLFFSLAFIKRYSELMMLKDSEARGASARGYVQSDRPLLLAQGSASGYLAVLVLALYTNTRMLHEPSGRSGIFWLTCLLLFYWISYLWRTVEQGKITTDPVSFALTDRTSRWVIVAMVASVLAAV